MKKIVFFIIIVICFLSIIHSVSSIINLWKKKEVLVHAQKELNIAQKQHTYLLSQLTVVQQASYVEKEARNKLFMAKTGENTVIISKSLLISPIPQQLSTKQHQSNLQQWIALFL